jgi:hypothetical protein
MLPLAKPGIDTMNQRKISRNRACCGVMIALVVNLTAAFAEDPNSPKNHTAAGVEQLAPFRDFVGEWRGVGQPQRGSTRGAWTERGQWQWRYQDGAAALAFQSPQGKLIREAELRPTMSVGVYDLIVKQPPPDPKSDSPASETTYTGKADADGRLVVTAADPPADLPARITLGLVASGDRLLMLLERKAPAGERFSRLAEVGYTREGSQFGKGNTQPECVVTGGHGSIAVKHEGKTYYVCCSGCRDLFNEDPAKTLAEYRQRKAEEKEKAK